MKVESIHIDDPDTVRDINALAERTGVPAEQAVAEAVREKLGQPAAVGLTKEQKMSRIREILQRIEKLPIVGPLLGDEDFYDEQGLPRQHGGTR